MKIIRSVVLGIGIDKVFCVSRYAQEVVVYNYKIRKSLTDIIYNGVDLSEYQIVKKDEKIVKIILVANLIPGKGVEYLIKAIPQIPFFYERCLVTIVGDGPSMRYLEQLVEDLNIKEKIVFLGRRDDVPQLMVQANIAVVPSVVPEGFGFTVVEAMAAGLPVIASNVGAIPELIEDGINGFLVEPFDEEAIANRLAYLIENPQSLSAMGVTNRKKAADKFSLDRMCKDQMKIYFGENANL